jgi:hypothetical protein
MVSMKIVYSFRSASLFAVSLVTALILIGVLVALFSTGRVEAKDYQQNGPPYPDSESSSRAAADWLIALHENDDGGFSNFSIGANEASSDVGGTVDALLALATARAEVSSQIAYLSNNTSAVASYAAQDGSTAGKLVLGLSAAGQDPADFAGYNFTISLTNHLSPTGQYHVQTAFNQSLALLGVAAAGEVAPLEALEWLVGLQETQGDLAGSWDDGFGTPGNADSTAMALMALATSRGSATDDAIVQGMEFLARTQLGTGGWEYGAGFGENANSTALVIQSLVALGEDVASADSAWAVGGRTPFDALLSWQGESGAFQADFGDGPFDDFFSTVQSIPAVVVAAVPDKSKAVESPTPVDTPESEPAQPRLATETSAPGLPTVSASPEPSASALTIPAVETATDVAIGTETDTSDIGAGSGIPLWLFVMAVVVIVGLIVLMVRWRNG